MISDEVQSAVVRLQTVASNSVLSDLAPEPARACLGCGKVLGGRERQWCRSCKGNGSKRGRLLQGRCPRCRTVFAGGVVPDPCPACEGREVVASSAALAVCPKCGTGFIEAVPDPCPSCLRKGA